MGAILEAIHHSAESEPVWVVDGIGPARFRSHFLRLSTGLVLDLSVSEVEVIRPAAETTAGETAGLPISDVLGRQIEGIALDDVDSPIVLLQGGLYLKDNNEGFYGNPLIAGRVDAGYNDEERAGFRDFWTGEPL